MFSEWGDVRQAREMLATIMSYHPRSRKTLWAKWTQPLHPYPDKVVQRGNLRILAKYDVIEYTHTVQIKRGKEWRTVYEVGKYDVTQYNPGYWTEELQIMYNDASRIETQQRERYKAMKFGKINDSPEDYS